MHTVCLALLLVLFCLPAWGQVGISTYYTGADHHYRGIGLRTSPDARFSGHFRLIFSLAGLKDDNGWRYNVSIGPEIGGYYRIKVGYGVHVLTGAGVQVVYFMGRYNSISRYAFLLPAGIEVDPRLRWANITVSFEAAPVYRIRRFDRRHNLGLTYFIGLTYYFGGRWGTDDCPSPF